MVVKQGVVEKVMVVEMVLGVVEKGEAEAVEMGEVMAVVEKGGAEAVEMVMAVVEMVVAVVENVRVECGYVECVDGGDGGYVDCGYVDCGYVGCGYVGCGYVECESGNYRRMPRHLCLLH